MVSFQQTVKPASLVALGGTLRRASLARGRLKVEVVPFPTIWEPASEKAEIRN
jgi:hypothetical protein